MKKENHEVLVKILDRAEKLGVISRTAYPRMTLLMDLENVDDEIGLDFDKLLNTDNYNFTHDIAGIQGHINRTTKKLENCFVPRCATQKPKYLRIVEASDEDTVKCPHCESDMHYTQVTENVKQSALGLRVTHIWSCEDCPNVMFEYIDKVDTENLAEYLNGDYRKERKAMLK